ncbi:uncharacterized protein EMH_0049910 [Eimeria mitis]|uniref:Uncharacterized protein n=1 Tax=Eimeria mitis TaxID=44415 RepID=U6K833_9EIME|nr:uncharacterized protein EMH_0049910 [Eimeria mitis]CDJ32981.1 hypothetical protein, conserved [Eimeria mitis]
MSSPPLETAKSACEAVFPTDVEGQGGMWDISTHASTHDSILWEEEGISFPLSQPDPPRRHPTSSSASVQRRRRSAACCSAPYVAAAQQSGVRRSRRDGTPSRRKHSPPQEVTPGSPARSCVDNACKDDCPSQEEAEKAARDMTEAAVASASAFAADARAIDPASYESKPTAFLYRGHTAQIATSTAGMYGEMIESFIKQVVAYAKQYGADQFSVFCDLGSGRGAPSAIAAYEHDWLACLGIEKCPQAFGLSLETQRCLLLREASARLRDRDRDPLVAAKAETSAGLEKPVADTETKSVLNKDIQELFEARPMRAVAFAHDDLSAFLDLEGVTHAYSFDAAMEGPLINFITHMFMQTETWWFYLSFRNDLISRFDLKGAEIKHQISSSMWVSSEGRTAYVYVKTDWKERQQRHRRWLREHILAPQLQQQEKQHQLLRHVRIQQQLVLQQLQKQDEQASVASATAAAAAADFVQRTPRSSRRNSVGTPRCRSSSRKRYSAAAEAIQQQQQQQQDMVLFHLAARRQQLQVLEDLGPEEWTWGGSWGGQRQQKPQKQQQRAQQQSRQQQRTDEGLAEDDAALLEQLRAFRTTHLRLSKWHQPLTVQSLLLVALLPFEGQNQWLQLQKQLLQPASGVLTRAQRLLLLGYDEGERKEEELSRDRWLEQLAAVPGTEDASALRKDIYTRLTDQRKQDRSLFTFLPPDKNACAASTGDGELPDGASIRLGFRHSLKELQERQSPMRSPRCRSSGTPIASREQSPVRRSRVWGDAADAGEALAYQRQLPKTPNRTPARQPARRRLSSQSMSPVASRGRASGFSAAIAALGAADAAAAATPTRPKGAALAAVGTPNTCREFQRVEKELQGLVFRAAEEPPSNEPDRVPMSQDTS